MINLRDSPFIYSHDFNKFLIVGCNNFSSLQSNGTTVGGYASSYIVLFICENTTLRRRKIISPSDSPNIDGIKMGRGTTNVRISNIFCGFGHEISVGSLGKYESEQDLDDIIVTNCTFSGTSIDVRIKS
ncbi:polygalacturonase/glycoside hydrolase family protein [Medicago truncatula]|uniref:Polygalacturonase/glycoside hydrolase family protein n=1 Tax=Medicago truncatula TaxID=3880 RepID=G7KW35_MEDTR|nr:polygalacturonase/glycoside hydrolase family protein [Medicago truncatula]